MHHLADPHLEALVAFEAKAFSVCHLVRSEIVLMKEVFSTHSALVITVEVILAVLLHHMSLQVMTCKTNIVQLSHEMSTF